MSELIPVKAYTRRKKVDLPPDPLSSSFATTRERIAKTREDIRKEILVLDAVPAEDDDQQERFLDCILRLVRGVR